MSPTRTLEQRFEDDDGADMRNWRDKLLVPNSVNEAIEMYPNERFLAEGAIRTRNSRWKLFVRWARDPSNAEKFKHEFTPLDLCEYMAEIADIALETNDQVTDTIGGGALADTNIQKVDDYISTANQRLIALKIFRNASAGEYRLFANRVNLVAGSYNPAKVVPADSRLISGLMVDKARRLARLWFYGGWRISGFEAINRGCFADDTACNPRFRRIATLKSKYAVSTQIEQRDIPREIADVCKNDFPVSREYINTYILAPMERSAHCFRRALALAIRTELHELGFTNKVRLALALPAINRLCGWAKDSKEFYGYTDDFKAWTGKSFDNVGEYCHYIREFVISTSGQPKWLR